MNRRALAGYEKVLGVEHPSTLTSVGNLAMVLQYQGKYEAAEEMNRRALAGCEKVLGVDHPDTLTSVSNLAAVLRYQGKYEAAAGLPDLKHTTVLNSKKTYNTRFL
jgi:tetratricopeptide (TPR) repeat protein